MAAFTFCPFNKSGFSTQDSFGFLLQNISHCCKLFVMIYFSISKSQQRDRVFPSPLYSVLVKQKSNDTRVCEILQEHTIVQTETLLVIKKARNHSLFISCLCKRFQRKVFSSMHLFSRFIKKVLGIFTHFFVFKGPLQNLGDKDSR